MGEMLLEDLLDLLTGLYDDPSAARDVAERAGLKSRFIDFQGNMMKVWMAVLREARRRGVVEQLIEVARSDYPSAPFSAMKTIGDATRGPKIDTLWQSTADLDGALEKVMGMQPTFLPVAFLETGLRMAQSVARIVAPNGVGTGFLTAGNVLLTNHHVIPTQKAAEESKVQFNFQESVDGLLCEVAEYTLAPELGFATSPVESGDDWTAVRVSGDATSDWGSIDLLKATVAPQDYVNIIQHPSGLPKQIALYHNLVTTVDSNRIQYLTDTLPGSSGSPVFDSQWRLVAIHHSGGWLIEPGTKRVVFRNQGISIQAVLEGLTNTGMLNSS